LARKIRTKISERGNISILYEKHAITSLLLERKNIIKLNRKIKTPNIVADSNVLLQNIILSLISIPWLIWTFVFEFVFQISGRVFKTLGRTAETLGTTRIPGRIFWKCSRNIWHFWSV